MKLIRTDVPHDAPTNPHPAASPEWGRWNQQARASTDYVLLIPVNPCNRPMIIPYLFLSEYRGPIERGDARWVSVAALLEREEAPAIRVLQAVLEPQSLA